ncbi:hypothetical protein [Thermocrinis sp.]
MIFPYFFIRYPLKKTSSEKANRVKFNASKVSKPKKRAKGLKSQTKSHRSMSFISVKVKGSKRRKIERLGKPEVLCSSKESKSKA